MEGAGALWRYRYLTGRRLQSNEKEIAFQSSHSRASGDEIARLQKQQMDEMEAEKKLKQQMATATGLFPSFDDDPFA